MKTERSPESVPNIEDDFGSIASNFELRPAIGRNFTFAVEKGNEENNPILSIILAHEDGRKIDLITYLPPGFSFVEDTTYGVDQTKKTIGIPLTRLAGRGAPLAIFHELGHAWESQSEKMQRLVVKYRQAAENTVRNKIAVQMLLEDFGGGFDDDLDVLGKIPLEEMYDHALLSPWLNESVHDIRAARERHAHAWALRHLRTLQKEGTNVFAGFSSTSDIRRTVSAMLWTYELDRLLSLTDQEVESAKLKYLRKKDASEVLQSVDLDKYETKG